MSWHAYRDGSTIGTGGSEDGRILRDEEHDDGARVTLEAVSLSHRAPFAITCGVYGAMVHTCFFGSETAAQQTFEEIKLELVKVLDALPERDDPDAEAKLRAVGPIFGEFVRRF